MSEIIYIKKTTESDEYIRNRYNVFNYHNDTHYLIYLNSDNCYGVCGNFNSMSKELSELVQFNRDKTIKGLLN